MVIHCDRISALIPECPQVPPRVRRRVLRLPGGRCQAVCTRYAAQSRWQGKSPPGDAATAAGARDRNAPAAVVAPAGGGAYPRRSAESRWPRSAYSLRTESPSRLMR